MEDKKVNIVLFGPPGAGKGTQGEMLVNDHNLHKVSTGDLLRKEIDDDSALGKKIKNIIDQGLLVSDEIINNLIEKILSNKSYFNRLIFDGYPRNLNQAKSLDELMKKYKQNISCVLSLKVDKDSIIKRILGRLVCSSCGKIFNEFLNKSSKKNHSCDPKFLQKRSDDNIKTLNSRIEIYNKETFPILSYYQSKKLLQEIDGMNEIDQIYKEIQQIIHSLET